MSRASAWNRSRRPGSDRSSSDRYLMAAGVPVASCTARITVPEAPWPRIRTCRYPGTVQFPSMAFLARNNGERRRPDITYATFAAHAELRERDEVARFGHDQ